MSEFNFGTSVSLDEIKGNGFNESSDNLHQISTKVKDATSQTELIRADTGELNGSAVLDLFVTNNLTLTGDITVKNLYVMDGATLNGNYKIVVEKSAKKESSFVYEIVDKEEEIELGENFRTDIELINNDDEDYDIDIWSYVYKGNKCYSGEREENKQSFVLEYKSSYLFLYSSFSS